jgi:hypothetical protein
MIPDRAVPDKVLTRGKKDPFVGAFDELFRREGWVTRQTNGVSIEPLANAAVQSYLEAVDSAAPELVGDVYLTGSVVLGDFRPGISDVDLVAVWATFPDEVQLEVLTELHRPSSPQVDVVYLAREDLRSDPRQLSPAHSLQGVFHRDGAFAANPVTWRELQTRSLAVRGPSLEAGSVWFDAGALRRWNIDNLEQYWRRQVDAWQQVDPTEEQVRHEYGLQWLVLGVPRLHYTVATLQVTSKTKAGHYALGVVERRWHPVIHTAIALRGDRAAALRLSPEQARDQAVELATWLIDDAHRLCPD